MWRAGFTGGRRGLRGWRAWPRAPGGSLGPSGQNPGQFPAPRIWWEPPQAGLPFSSSFLPLISRGPILAEWALMERGPWRTRRTWNAERVLKDRGGPRGWRGSWRMEGSQSGVLGGSLGLSGWGNLRWFPNPSNPKGGFPIGLAFSPSTTSSCP